MCTHEDVILNNATIKKLIGNKCDGVIGQVIRRAIRQQIYRTVGITISFHFLVTSQLTEDWGDELFGALKQAKGRAFSNYAVGYNNVDVPVLWTLPHLYCRPTLPGPP